jgi:hypothetical protein
MTARVVQQARTTHRHGDGRPPVQARGAGVFVHDLGYVPLDKATVRAYARIVKATSARRVNRLLTMVLACNWVHNG